jgi:signal transduction histidine kinase
MMKTDDGRSILNSYLQHDGVMHVTGLRLLELFAFFIIVFCAQWLANLQYQTEYLLVLFIAASALQYAGNAIWAAVGRRRSWAQQTIETVSLWCSSYVDLAVVLALIYVTGTVQSPFLFMLIIPLFFITNLVAPRKTIVYFAIPALAITAALGYLELSQLIRHFNCYSFADDMFLNPHYYVGALLVLGAILGLMLYLSSTFRGRLQRTLSVLTEGTRASGDRILELTKLVDISMGINSVISLETLLKIVAKEATLLLVQPWAGIVLFNNKHEATHAVFVGSKHGDRRETLERIKRDGLSEWIHANNEPIVIENVERDRRTRRSDFCARNGIQSLIGYPMVSGKQIIGAIYAGDYTPKQFEGRQIRLLALLGHHLTVAIEKSKLYESLENKIQDYKKTISNLEKANGLKTDFCSHVSHELKTPLTAMKAYVETLLTHIDDPHFERRREFLDIVARETDRLIRIVRDILDISRLGFGERPLARAACSIEKIISDVLSTMQPALDAKRMRVHMLVSDNLPNVDGDQDLLKQVFINLLNNAIKYSPDGSTIHMTVEERAVELAVSIRDEGIGIPEEALENIFDKYFRVKSEKSITYDGAGLGLAIVKNIVEQHGGYVAVESEEGKGSTFTFTVPKEHCVNDLVGYISELVSAKEDLHEMLQLIVRMIAEMLSAKIVSLMLLDKDRSELFIKVSYGLEDWIVEQTRVKLGEGIAGKVAQSGQPLFIDNIEQNEVYASPNNPQYETMSLLSVPLFVNKQIVGVINVNNKISGECFDQDDMNLLISFSERMSRALERVRRKEDSHAFLEDTIEAFRKMLEHQDKTKSIETLVDLAVRLSRRLGLDEKEVRVVQYVASVHDIGMTKVSDEILNKALDLSSEEKAKIQQHPKSGTELMRPLEFVELASNIILYHHECVDGSGYPMGLRGDEIPIGSRILAVIDAYQSMTSDKPYRKKLDRDETIAELINCSGTQFDRRVVEAFVAVLSEERQDAAGGTRRSKRQLKRRVVTPSH